VKVARKRKPRVVLFGHFKLPVWGGFGGAITQHWINWIHHRIWIGYPNDGTPMYGILKP